MDKANCNNCGIKSKAVGALNDTELDFLNRNCAEVMLSRGERIIKEGQLSSHIAYIKTGLAKIHMMGPRGRDQILKIVTPGSYIGIQTILAERIHKYSASALEESKVCYIDITSFKELLKRNPDFANEIILYLCSDELSYFERFVNMSQKQANGRLADTLIFFADTIYMSHTFHLSLTRTDLSELLGVTRESISRALKELTEIGAITAKGKLIEILNFELLIKISKIG